jgi:branched-chain amino acid transport system substrate-binding protein
VRGVGRRSSRWLVIAALLGALVLSLAACGSDEGDGDGAALDSTKPSEQATETFKLAVSAPYTGALARTGDEFKGAVELALGRIGSQIGPYKIEPVYVDEGTDAAQAASATEQAIVGDGAQAGCLNWLSSNAVSMMDVAAKHKVPWMFGIGATGLVNEQFSEQPPEERYWTTKGWPTPTKLTPLYVEALNHAIEEGDWTPDQKVAALAAEESDYGRDVTNAAAEAFEATGWEVSSKEFFPLSSTDHYSLLNKFKDAGASVVYLQGQADTMTSLLKQAQEVGLEALIIGDGLNYVADFYKLTGAASDYVLDEQPAFQASEEAEAFQSEFEEKVGFAPSSAAGGLAYDWFNFCLEVLRRAEQEHGSLSSENVFKVVRDEVWTGELTWTEGIVMNRYAFAPEELPDPVLGEEDFSFTVVQYFGGEPTTIYPPSRATAPLKVR